MLPYPSKVRRRKKDINGREKESVYSTMSINGQEKRI